MALAHSIRDKPVDDAMIALMKKRGAWQQAATLTREMSSFAFANPPAWLDDPFFKRGVTAGCDRDLEDARDKRQFHPIRDLKRRSRLRRRI